MSVIDYIALMVFNNHSKCFICFKLIFKETYELSTMINAFEDE